MDLAVVTSLVPRSCEGGSAVAILLLAPLDRSFTCPTENSYPKHENKSLRERPLPGALTVGLFSSGNA
jgi:hypothetical protein